MFIQQFEKFVKIFILLVYGLFFLVDYACTNGGNFEYAEPYSLPVCNVENKKISRYLENVNIPYLCLFIKGTHGLYSVYHIYYENEVGERINIITYKFPFTYGLDVPMEDTNIFIEEFPDAIKFYYNRDPIGGFVIDNNPFSKKIQMEYIDQKQMFGVCHI